jgi:hypothetical protein
MWGGRWNEPECTVSASGHRVSAMKRNIAISRDVRDDVVISRDVRDVADGVVINAGKNVKHRGLIIRRGQLVDDEILLNGQEKYDVEQQDNGANLLKSLLRRGGSNKGEMQW